MCPPVSPKCRHVSLRCHFVPLCVPKVPLCDPKVPLCAFMCPQSATLCPHMSPKCHRVSLRCHFVPSYAPKVPLCAPQVPLCTLICPQRATLRPPVSPKRPRVSLRRHFVPSYAPKVPLCAPQVPPPGPEVVIVPRPTQGLQGPPPTPLPGGSTAAVTARVCTRVPFHACARGVCMAAACVCGCTPGQLHACTVACAVTRVHDGTAGRSQACPAARVWGDTCVPACPPACAGLHTRVQSQAQCIVALRCSRGVRAEPAAVWAGALRAAWRRLHVCVPQRLLAQHAGHALHR